MMKRLLMTVSMLSFLFVGCSGSVNGQVGGVSLTVADAIFAVLKDDAGKSTGLFVVLADKPKLCDSLKANREPKSSTSLVFALSRVSDTSFLAPDVGDYTVIDQNPTQAGNFAFGSFSRTDSNCTNTLSTAAAGAKSGLVKLTALKGEANGVASASFDVTFGGGDKITGNFNASFCDISKLQPSPNCE
jgi:hypothetical protein